MLILFDCTFKKIKAIDNIELNTGKKLSYKKLKFSYPMVFEIRQYIGKYINWVFETRTTREKKSLSYTIYLWFNMRHITIKLFTQVVTYI